MDRIESAAAGALRADAPVGPTSRFVRAGDADVAYVRDGSGPAVLLLQGVGLPGRAWQPQVDDLRGRYTTIAIDNRGVGASRAGRAPLTIERMALDAVAVLDAEGVSACHVIGHSMGGLIALQLALLTPTRMRSLSLLCTFATGTATRRLSPSSAWIALKSRVGTRAMRRRAMLRLVLPDAYLAAVGEGPAGRELGALFARDLADLPPVAMRQLRAMARCDLTARLRELRTIPTLVASGALDRIAPPRWGHRLAAGLAARCVVFPHAGHALPIQCARGVNATLIWHLASAERGGRPTR